MSTVCGSRFGRRFGQALYVVAFEALLGSGEDPLDRGPRLSCRCSGFEIQTTVSRGKAPMDGPYIRSI